MNDLQIFQSSEFGQVRMVEINKKPYAVGVDVARALGYKNPSKAVIQHCKGITKAGIPSKGGIQETNVIPEGDIYRLIIKSELPSAERFEKWVFDEVLPSIRKNGMYVTEVKLQQKIFNAMKVEMTSLVDEIVTDKINQIEEKCSQYFRPLSKEKQNICKYIKKRLGIDKADEEYELVKQRVLIKLGGEKWEDIPVETLVNSLNIIDESIRIIKSDRQVNQLSIFEIAN
ncbi:hypothetical protein FQB35_09960 [Crassaminicella thermophila]|uniref:Bro-N domain-containing protein n=1 Tax=Crassaminicella thermophila TaxID=2599308 RepID=A0A5C0SDJ6_CRATE|nr:BRO family protein [Crassaminicella thermophila]QEK12625.1 hypothetical protein FQB35_09960 [Crassaminicella thermophila]